MSARHDKDDRRKRDVPVLQKYRFDMSRKVMNGHDRFAQAGGHRLRKRHADKQRTDQAGPLRHRQGIDVVPRRLRIGQGAIDDTADIAHVLARRNLGYHPAPFAMDVDLGRDDIGPRGPRARFVARGRYHGGGCLITRCLDTEDVHGAHPAKAAGGPPLTRRTIAAASPRTARAPRPFP
jgi:hypothetical protein